jgi:hypothetical protein
MLSGGNTNELAIKWHGALLLFYYCLLLLFLFVTSPFKSLGSSTFVVFIFYFATNDEYTIGIKTRTFSGSSFIVDKNNSNLVTAPTTQNLPTIWVYFRFG